jgi:hypothetical protein
MNFLFDIVPATFSSTLKSSPQAPVRFLLQKEAGIRFSRPRDESIEISSEISGSKASTNIGVKIACPVMTIAKFRVALGIENAKNSSLRGHSVWQSSNDLSVRIMNANASAPLDRACGSSGRL